MRRAAGAAALAGAALAAAGGVTAVATAERPADGAGPLAPLAPVSSASRVALLSSLALGLDGRAESARDARIAAGYAAVVPRRRIVARASPAGAPVARVAPRRASGGPLVLAVGGRHGRWVGVRLPERPNARLAWVPAGDVRWRALRTRVEVDLSERELVVRHDGRVVLRTDVAVGRATNPTPAGRYGVADHVRLEPGPSNPYGAGALPLTGHQTRLPAGWPGGDRLAIHGATDEGTVGALHAAALGPAAPPAARGAARRHGARHGVTRT